MTSSTSTPWPQHHWNHRQDSLLRGRQQLFDQRWKSKTLSIIKSALGNRKNIHMYKPLAKRLYLIHLRKTICRKGGIFLIKSKPCALMTPGPGEGYCKKVQKLWLCDIHRPLNIKLGWGGGMVDKIWYIFSVQKAVPIYQ